MVHLQLIGGIISLLATIPLFIGIYRDKIRQSFITYLLWGFLDIITAITIILQHGNYWLPIGYSLSSIIVACLLMVKKQITWGWIEMITTLLVIICLLVWWKMGDRAALIASVISLGIASVPQIIETYKNPSATPTGIYSLFLIADTLSLLSGKEWNVEQLLYSASAFFLCSLLIILSIRRPVLLT